MNASRTWWSVDALAASGLPGVPGTTRGVNRLAERAGWRSDPAKFRRSPGRGRGWEYHRDVLPQEALMALSLAPVSQASPKPAAFDRAATWAAFEAAPQRMRDEAAERLTALKEIDALVLAGATATAAVAHVAKVRGKGVRTVYNWQAAIVGVPAEDWLAALLPRRGQKGPSVLRTQVDPEFAALVMGDYLRLAQRSLQACYDDAVDVAHARGIPVCGYKALARWKDREVSPQTEILARKGIERLRDMYPPQVRTKAAMHAMQAVNGDFHRFDVFVRWPAERGQPEKIIRPQMVAFQDVYSGKLVSFRVDQTPNAQAVRLCIGDMIERYGIPKQVTLDNGREFAAKAITGGTPNRYRFKVLEADMPGLLTQLGCDVHWATPYSGQSKPIERAFRDLCDRVSKDPRFDGAYTGNNPTAKPEDYGSRAIPLDMFLEVLAQGIEKHNSRQGRRSEVAWGRSFTEVFEESYAEAPIRKATAEQRRLWLMGAEKLRANKRSGEITLMGNKYWADWLLPYAGQLLIGRFDPAALWDGLHVYDPVGRYLGEAECREKIGFYDVDAAQTHAKARRAFVVAEKQALEALRRKTAAEVGAGLDAVAPVEDTAPVATVIMPDFKGRGMPAQAGPATDEEVRAQTAIIEDLAQRRSERVEDAGDDEDRVRFRRALELERSRDAGERLTREQDQWLQVYQQSSDYRAQSALYADFGETMFAGMSGSGTV